MKMQEGFLWGGATAANQCEGSASAGPFALFWGYTLTSASTDTSPSRSNTGWM